MLETATVTGGATIHSISGVEETTLFVLLPPGAAASRLPLQVIFLLVESGTRSLQTLHKLHGVDQDLAFIILRFDASLNLVAFGILVSLVGHTTGFALLVPSTTLGVSLRLSTSLGHCLWGSSTVDRNIRDIVGGRSHLSHRGSLDDVGNRSCLSRRDIVGGRSHLSHRGSLDDGGRVGHVNDNFTRTSLRDRIGIALVDGSVDLLDDSLGRTGLRDRIERSLDGSLDRTSLRDRIERDLGDGDLDGSIDRTSLRDRIERDLLDDSFSGINKRAGADKII